MKASCYFETFMMGSREYMLELAMKLVIEPNMGRRRGEPQSGPSVAPEAMQANHIKREGESRQ
jgi:hypothetical protein